MTMQLAVESLVVVTYSNVPVITTGLLAHLYKTEEKHIRQNFKRNECRFIAGKHFFKVSGCELDSLRTSQRGLQISPKTRSLILWTERGAARHAKMLETDRAWEVFEKLEDCYFSQKIPEQLQLPESTLSINYPLSWFSDN
ncbi:ORF6N domain-containing protein, partial [Escherichia coli]